MDPRVTILLPTHNRADVLGYAIRSALWQTEQDFELLIVGDGCTDETGEVVAGFPDPRIRWFDLPKAPLSGYANRNIALRLARGRYVTYAQHDDIMLPDHIERLVEALEAAGADWAYSRPLWCVSSGFMLPFFINLTHQDELAHYLGVENHIPSCCVLHRRDALERVGYWPEDIAAMADWICWRRMIETSTSRNAGYCPLSTALHFRAIWKTRDVPATEWLEQAARLAPWWPAACKLPIPPGLTEQQVFFDALASDPAAWAARLRAGIAAIADRLSWGGILPAARTWPMLPDAGH
jgi:glycosyltransferase involved in cell wall biosynthesis